MPNSLRIFISSTSDLEDYRDVCTNTLAELQVEGSRFETWPPSPLAPMDECLRRIDECDAVILIVGGTYGAVVDGGLSATHTEYEYALQSRKPVFIFLCDGEPVEPAQARFIQQLESARFRGRRIHHPDALQAGVRECLSQEFARCFREVHSLPPKPGPALVNDDPPPPSKARASEAPTSTNEALHRFDQLLESRDERRILDVASFLSEDVRADKEVMNYVAMAAVNLASAGEQVPKKLLVEAVELWTLAIEVNETPEAGRYYNLGNAYSALGRVESAILNYNRALELDAEYAQCLKNLGSCHIQAGAVDEACRCFEKALDADPVLAEALYSLGTIALAEHDDPATAQVFFDRIWLTNMRPEQVAGVMAWKAHVNMHTGETQKGIACAEQAIAIAPNQDWSWSSAVRHYVVVKYYGTAWQLHAALFWHRYLARYPESAEAHAELGVVYFLLSQTAKYQNVRNEATSKLERALLLGLDQPTWIHELLDKLAT